MTVLFYITLSTQGLAAQDAVPIAGPAIVVDGDTLEINGERLRLEGIDAPEMSQSCKRADGQDWACGRTARAELERLTRQEPVMCDRKGQDKYGRTLALCFVAGEDLGATLVRQGLARAFTKYSVLYNPQEREAREQQRGIWQAENMAPWDYRQNRWQTAEEAAPSGCAIKGNVSHKGRIYHAPWSPWYDKVKVDEARGERWFCDEAEALAAGWRPAQQL